MVAKRNISVKLSDDQIQTLKAIATEQGKTLTDIVVGGMSAAVERVDLTRKIQELQDRIQEMESKGKKTSLGKRISVPVSRDEFRKISIESAKAGLPKGRFVRELLINGTLLPALT